MTNRSLVEKAIKKAGGAAALAKRLGISEQAFTYWKRKGRIPSDRVIGVEKATGGQVTRQQLRPDLYPDAAR